MPLRDVGDAMRDMRAGSRMIRSRRQAVAAGMEAQRRTERQTKRGRRKGRRARR